jgi:hypothetical protein
MAHLDRHAWNYDQYGEVIAAGLGELF